MKKRLIIPLIILSQFLVSQKTKSYVLTQTEFDDVKNFLRSKNLEIRDTIIIKYEFNGDYCWNYLDTKDISYINRIINYSQNDKIEFNNSHPGAIIYHIRENGNNFNLLVKNNNRIIVDDHKILRQIIFDKRKTCGSSVILMDDGSYLIEYNDSHFNLLTKLKNKIESNKVKSNHK